MGMKEIYYDKNFMSNLMKNRKGDEYNILWLASIQN